MSRPGTGAPGFPPALRSIPLLAVTVVGLAFLPPPASAAPPERVALRWIGDPADTKALRVEVTGLSAAVLHEIRREVIITNWPSARWNQLLSIRVEQGDLFTDIGLPPVQGKHAVTDHTLRFEAQFWAEPGVHYRAVFHPDKLPGGVPGTAPLSVVCHMPPRRAVPTTVVSRVYPSADLLPENLLKFYLHFSAPMRRGHIYDHIHLRDADGRLVDLPFLELDEELWDPAMMRLTLFIDPGRIKREVKPLEDIGPALEAGKIFTLELSREWKDAAGAPLKEDFKKRFQVGPPDREPPEPSRWKISEPRAGTREPVRLTFNKPMDHALASRMIRVTHDGGELLSGSVELDDGERRWSFTPFSAWRRGPCRLLIQTTIEDLAGNNIGKPFEVDVVETGQRRLTNSTVRLSFEVR